MAMSSSTYNGTPTMITKANAFPEEEEVDDVVRATSSNVKFGTPEAVEYVRNLTDVGAMTRLLHECIAYQRALDLELENILSQQTHLDNQLTTLYKSAEVLDIVQNEYNSMLSNVRSTCHLANQVSGKDPAEYKRKVKQQSKQYPPLV